MQSKLFLLFFISVLLASCQNNNATTQNTTAQKDNTQNKVWWKEAIVYQIYPRSFKDTDGDGIGDLKGVTQNIDYVKSLGIDMVWINPIFASPNKDNGYDISDYQNIMKEFGTMQDCDAMIKGFHDKGIKVLFDLVVNHCSDEHEWFKQARTSRQNPYYKYFHWWPAEKGTPPTRWSHFDAKADAWEYNKATNSYYLHYFADAQPDLNWENPAVRQEIYKMMRFWLDKGIDGFRLDAFAFISKDTTWGPLPAQYNGRWGMFYADGPHLHDYTQEMNREVLSKYNVTTVAEAMGDVPRIMKFVDEDRKELQMAYHFEGTELGYVPNEFKKHDPNSYTLKDWKAVYTKWNDAFTQKGWGTIYLANHDQARMVSRWGNDTPEFREISAKMLNTFILTMRGTPYTYYGDELAMNNIRFNKIEEYNDIECLMNYEQVKAKKGDLKEFIERMKITGRDNGRTPMQWDATLNAGFSTGKPWLPVNPNYTYINVAAQDKNPNSMLNYFRTLTKMRKENPLFAYGSYKILDNDNLNTYSYIRELDGKKVLILLNFKPTTAAAKTGIDLSKAKILVNNYSDFAGESQLKPYQAVVLAL
jgi:oligo-1,6-glucosidase